MHLSSRIATAAILVLSLLGCTDGNIRTSNNLPEVVIQQPVDGSTHPADQPLELRGRAIDTGAGGGITEVAWTSDVSGVLFEGPADDSDGNTAFVWEAPEGGPHEITLRATDTAGATARETISLTIAQDLAPDCTITSPTGAVILDSSQPILLQGQVDDDITAVTELAIAWTSDIDDLLDDSAADETGVTSALVEVIQGMTLVFVLIAATSVHYRIRRPQHHE